MIVICGGNIAEGIRYSREHDLGYPRATVLKDHLGLHGIGRGAVLRLVDAFHTRPDVEVILREARVRKMKVEDLT